MREERWLFGGVGRGGEDFDDGCEEWSRLDDEEWRRRIAAWRKADREARQAGRRPFASWSTREIGRAGERLAASYLQDRGYEIERLNFTCPKGEADIIARDGEDVVLIEVKTRVGAEDEASMPELAVDKAKRNRYMQIAAYYQADVMREMSMRFDVIAVNLMARAEAHLHHIIGAFEGDQI